MQIRRVNYKIFDKTTIINDLPNSSCYSFITYNILNINATDIILYHRIEYVPFSEEECKLWITYLNTWGFVVEYLGIGSEIYDISKDFYVFKIPIKCGEKQIYSFKSWLNSALMLTRYLFEDCITDVLKKFFQLVQDHPELDTFKLMQLAHIHTKNGYNTNYTVRNEKADYLFSLQEIQERLNQKTNSIYANQNVSIHSLWHCFLPFPTNKIKNNTLKKQFKTLSVKKVITPVYIVGGNTNYANWLPDVELVDNPDKADIIMFTGGEDVDPSLYNQPKGKFTYSNLKRDLKEKTIFEKYKGQKKFIGICRGSQFLCVMAGGQLIQHQENPNREHEFTTYNGQTFIISSTHHQAAYLNNLNEYAYKLIGYTKNISKTHLNGNNEEVLQEYEPEIVFYRNIKALGIQGHPEFLDYQKRNPESLEYFKQLYTSFINNKL